MKPGWAAPRGALPLVPGQNVDGHIESAMGKMRDGRTHDDSDKDNNGKSSSADRCSQTPTPRAEQFRHAVLFNSHNNPTKLQEMLRTLQQQSISGRRRLSSWAAVLR